ncbi:MAG: hypothetical protein ACI9QQ_001555, partial [Myxococcota bacterium]
YDSLRLSVIYQNGPDVLSGPCVPRRNITSLESTTHS